MSRTVQSLTGFVPASALAIALALFLVLSGCVPVMTHEQLVARGAYLVNGPLACANCHTPRAPDFSLVADKHLAGGLRLAEPGIYDVYSANLTPDKDTGIGSLTDEQIITAIRTGKTREGRIIFPPMPVPTYNTMSDDDVKAVVAYLRTIKPVHNEVPVSKWSIPQQAMPPAKGTPAPSPSDKVAYGGYIVNSLAHCFECHTTHTPNSPRGAGGELITLAPGMTVRVANITQDKETGIGNWSDADIKKAITQGIRPDGRHLSPPMPFPWFEHMTEQDVDAVVAYVKTIPPVRNPVERTDFQKKFFK
jgi:mono/diheme cytochrome c family protein